VDKILLFEYSEFLKKIDYLYQLLMLVVVLNRATQVCENALDTVVAVMSPIGTTSNHRVSASIIVSSYGGLFSYFKSGGSKGPTMPMWTYVNLCDGVGNSLISFFV